MQDAESHLAALADAASGHSQADFESIALSLSPQEKRLYEYLREHGVANTIQIRQDCAIGNVSSAAMFLNRKFERHGEPLRVICETRSLTNRFGDRGALGYWRIAQTGNDAA